jgi:ERCC4 domain
LPKLSILIDSRERDRNATPRQMRMDLTRHVMSGLLSRVWPHNMPMVDVVEKCLLCGDFAFEIQKNELVQQRLPLAIERKRISDLVQRSAKGDHWKQFQATCSSSDYVTFLLEGDTSCAQQFSADGAQHSEDEWNPDSYLIDDDDSIFLFMGRALLNSRKTRFIQTRDVQGSLRAVGAFGLMMTLFRQSRKDTATPGLAKSHTQLADKLLAGGIPWGIAKRGSQEIGSVAAMDIVYQRACSQSARDHLMEPIIAKSLPRDYQDSITSVAGWSKAIHRVWTSQLKDLNVARQAFADTKDLVQDHSELLCLQHSGKSPEEALDELKTCNRWRWFVQFIFTSRRSCLIVFRTRLRVAFTLCKR